MYFAEVKKILKISFSIDSTITIKKSNLTSTALMVFIRQRKATQLPVPWSSKVANGIFCDLCTVTDIFANQYKCRLYQHQNLKIRLSIAFY